MTLSKLITGAMALALAASSAAPVAAAPAFAPPQTEKTFIDVQNRSQQEFGGDEDDLILKPGERRIRRDDDAQRRQIDRVPRGEVAPDGQPRRRIDGIPRGEVPRDQREVRREQNRFEQRENRVERREQRRQARIERRGQYYYYNGHRGYREKRRGYRYHDGYWFPPAAFALGVIIGGMNRGNPDWEDHVDWCYDRYGNRYRERDNTYISRSGYRRECVSPYS